LPCTLALKLLITCCWAVSWSRVVSAAYPARRGAAFAAARAAGSAHQTGYAALSGAGDAGLGFSAWRAALVASMASWSVRAGNGRVQLVALSSAQGLLGEVGNRQLASEGASSSFSVSSSNVRLVSRR
jgi:hypothetical protein